MEQMLLNRLGRVAYEAHVGKCDNDEYFQREIIEWQDLPDATQEHWKKIVKAVMSFSWDVDCGDLV